MPAFWVGAVSSQLLFQSFHLLIILTFFFSKRKLQRKIALLKFTCFLRFIHYKKKTPPPFLCRQTVFLVTFIKLENYESFKMRIPSKIIHPVIRPNYP